MDKDKKKPSDLARLKEARGKKAQRGSGSKGYETQDPDAALDYYFQHAGSGPEAKGEGEPEPDDE